jgi:hypothetical protein
MMSLDKFMGDETQPKAQLSPYDSIDLTYGFGGMQNELKLYCRVNNDLSNNRRKNLRSSYEFLPIRSGSMRLVLFDPPFVIDPGNPQVAVFDASNGFSPSFSTYKYGAYKSAERMRKSLFLCMHEIARVLEPGGIAVFKWCDTSKSFNWAKGLIPSKLRLERVSMRRSKTYPRNSSNNVHSTFFIWLKRQAPLRTETAPVDPILHDNGEEER